MDQRYFDQSENRRPRFFSRESEARQYRESVPFEQSYSQGGVVIHSPKTYKDVQSLIDHLKAHEQVIVDFSTVNQVSVYRILDFMSGAIYALGGSIQQIKKDLFLFVPKGVTITLPPEFNAK